MHTFIVGVGCVATFYLIISVVVFLMTDWRGWAIFTCLLVGILATGFGVFAFWSWVASVTA